AKDLVELGSVGVVAKDTDGDTATGTVKVTVSDDVPEVTIAADGATSVVEGTTTPVTGDWTLVRGADGVTSDHFTISIDGGDPQTVVLGSPITTDKGTLTLTEGQWSFVPAASLSNNAAGVSLTFTLKATDGDNDTTTVSHTIT